MIEASLEAERVTALVQIQDYVCKMIPVQQLCPYLLQALQMPISGGLALASWFLRSFSITTFPQLFLP